MYSVLITIHLPSPIAPVDEAVEAGVLPEVRGKGTKPASEDVEPVEGGVEVEEVSRKGVMPEPVVSRGPLVVLGAGVVEEPGSRVGELGGGVVAGAGAHVVVRGPLLVTLDHVTTGATRPVVPPPGPRQPALDTPHCPAHTFTAYCTQNVPILAAVAN